MMSNSDKVPVIHSMAFIDALQEMLGMDLGKCYKVVITADIDHALDVAIYMRGTQQHINGFRVFSAVDLAQNTRIITDYTSQHCDNTHSHIPDPKMGDRCACSVCGGVMMYISVSWKHK